MYIYTSSSAFSFKKSKIFLFICQQVRQKVLSSAYLRALKDPFPPARQAGILAMAATHNFFTLQESAQRLLPALCSMSLDPEKSVRDQVRIMGGFENVLGLKLKRGP